ncbi:hypothetical protein [Neisseria sp. Ec49-e6-T10]|uniref:hypothetical protein n=1 Tax=Neisseria sp. Ec49-e6-T10 TaxID=3140744 RepID=UPI003EBCDC5F
MTKLAQKTDLSPEEQSKRLDEAKAAHQAKVETQRLQVIEKQQIKVHDDFTVTGRLIHGVLFDGKLHYDFKMRMAYAGDTVKLKQDDPYARTIETYSRTLLKLGDIPSDQIDFEFLSSNTTDMDIDILYYADAELVKKRESVMSE